MKISLFKFGRFKYQEAAILSEHYTNRIRPFCAIETFIYKEEKKSWATVATSLSSSFVVACDEKGQNLDSIAFSKKMQSWFETYPKGIAFIVGGSYGIPQDIDNLVKARIALSKMVFTSDLAYVFLVEQIYRGFNIIKGTPYHH